MAFRMEVPRAGPGLRAGRGAGSGLGRPGRARRCDPAPPHAGHGMGCDCGAAPALPCSQSSASTPAAPGLRCGFPVLSPGAGSVGGGIAPRADSAERVSNPGPRQQGAGQERPRRPARCIVGAALIYAGPRSAPGAAGGGGGERGRERRERGGDRGSPGAQRFCRPLRPWRHRRAAGTTHPASADPAPATTDVEAAGGAGPGPRGPSRRGGAAAAR